jgi:hypothetical protein
MYVLDDDGNKITSDDLDATERKVADLEKECKAEYLRCKAEGESENRCQTRMNVWGTADYYCFQLSELRKDIDNYKDIFDNEPVNIPSNTCGNNQCDTGENCLSCITDCPCYDNEICSPSDSKADTFGCTLICGNGICEGNECSEGCVADCKIDNCCGDLSCDIIIGEDELTCPDDCVNCNLQCNEDFGPSTGTLIDDECECTCADGYLFVEGRCIETDCNEFCAGDVPNSIGIMEGGDCNCYCAEGFHELYGDCMTLSEMNQFSMEALERYESLKRNGLGDTPEAEEAYHDYIIAKEKFEELESLEWYKIKGELELLTGEYKSLDPKEEAEERAAIKKKVYEIYENEYNKRKLKEQELFEKYEGHLTPEMYFEKIFKPVYLDHQEVSKILFTDYWRNNIRLHVGEDALFYEENIAKIVYGTGQGSCGDTAMAVMEKLTENTEFYPLPVTSNYYKLGGFSKYIPFFGKQQNHISVISVPKEVVLSNVEEQKIKINELLIKAKNRVSKFAEGSSAAKFAKENVENYKLVKNKLDNFDEEYQKNPRQFYDPNFENANLLFVVKPKLDNGKLRLGSMKNWNVIDPFNGDIFSWDDWSGKYDGNNLNGDFEFHDSAGDAAWEQIDDRTPNDIDKRGENSQMSK